MGEVKEYDLSRAADLKQLVSEVRTWLKPDTRESRALMSIANGEWTLSARPKMIPSEVALLDALQAGRGQIVPLKTLCAVSGYADGEPLRGAMQRLRGKVPGQIYNKRARGYAYVP